MKTITLKTKYVKTDGWRGRLEPINAICGSNDTGNYSDSPCPSDVRKKEIQMVTSILRKNNIRYRTTWGQTSSVFCVAQYVVVSEQDKARAIELIEDLPSMTRLLYLC